MREESVWSRLCLWSTCRAVCVFCFRRVFHLLFCSFGDDGQEDVGGERFALRLGLVRLCAV